MNNLKPALFALLFIGLIVGVVMLNRSCKSDKPEPVAPTEQDRQSVATTNETEAAKYQKLADERLNLLEALQRDLTAATSKDKAATAKTRHSVDTYRKTPTLTNCDNALSDCAYENETKAYALAVQERMLAGFESSDSINRSEIDRLMAVSDTLKRGWQAANVKLAKVDNQLRVYATAAFEKQPTNNNLKIGGTATFKKFLIGYEKGIIQNTHEFRAGVLLRK